MIVTLSVFAGLGAVAIDAGINGFAALHFPARSLHWLHAAYGLGTTAGPALMTRWLMDGAPWRHGYVVLGGAQLALAGAFAATLKLWPAPGPSTGGPGSVPAAPLAQTLRLPAARLGALGFFLYLGVETTAGAWLSSLLEDGRGATMGAAGSAVSLYWGGLLAGRIAFGFVPTRWSPDRLLTPAITACAAAALTIALDPGMHATLAASALLGFAAAPIFPALIGSTPARVGLAHAQGTVLQVAAAALGQAGRPALVGVVAAHAGLEWVPRSVLLFALALWATHRRLAGVSQACVHDANLSGER